MNTKILILDIETAPNIVYTWGLYDQNIGVNQIIQDNYMLCWAAKWLGNSTLFSDALINYPKIYKKTPRNEKAIAESLHILMEEANIVVGQNSNSFDVRWINTLFLIYGLPPIDTYRKVDTKRVAKSQFYFVSNSLEYQCKRLGIGGKLKHEGFGLWKGCMAGEKEAWDKMIRYNKHDVRITEKLYLKQRPFIKDHPNLNLYEGIDKLICTNCGDKHLVKNGFRYTIANVYQRYTCMKCGKHMRGRLAIKNRGAKLEGNL